MIVIAISEQILNLCKESKNPEPSVKRGLQAFHSDFVRESFLLNELLKSSRKMSFAVIRCMRGF